MENSGVHLHGTPKPIEVEMKGRMDTVTVSQAEGEEKDSLVKLHQCAF